MPLFDLFDTFTLTKHPNPFFVAMGKLPCSPMYFIAKGAEPFERPPGRENEKGKYSQRDEASEVR
jgi:hypothetical protein